MPCMNSTSFGEAGGSVALVDAGKVRVAWPGAPGCTITGLLEVPCCAKIGSDTNKIKMPAPKSPSRWVVTLLDDRLVALKPKNFIRIGGFMNSTYHKPLLNSGLPSIIEFHRNWATPTNQPKSPPRVPARLCKCRLRKPSLPLPVPAT